MKLDRPLASVFEADLPDDFDLVHSAPHAQFDCALGAWRGRLKGGGRWRRNGPDSREAEPITARQATPIMIYLKF